MKGSVLCEFAPSPRINPLRTNIGAANYRESPGPRPNPAFSRSLTNFQSNNTLRPMRISAAPTASTRNSVMLRCT